MVKKKKAIVIERTLNVRDAVKNPTSFPWNYQNNYFTEINVLGVLEFIPGKLRGKFMDELYRILQLDGKINVIVPYWNSSQAVQDYKTEWPPFREQSFLYFVKQWREANKLDHDIKCDFDFTYGYSLDAETSARSEETKAFYVKHNNNCVQALQVSLTKVKNATNPTSK